MFGVSLAWDLAGAPIEIRFDPSLAYHGSDGRYDANLLILGFPAAIQYQFRNAQGPTPYVLGGIGLYYSNVSVDTGSPFLDEIDDSSLDFGIAIGGGLRFNSRVGLEVRVVDIDGFTTLPILLTIRF
jgi:opacity protein-like surface antigen